MDRVGEDLTDKGKAFHIFGSRKGVVNCFQLVGRCEVENELRLWYHNYEFDYWSEIKLERARGANDGDRKTKILQYKNNSL